MIKFIQFLDGFPLTLPAIGNKKFEFTDGINLLVGKNGCGKSTILKTLKAYCGIKTGGWTYFNNPQTLGCGRMNGHDFPHSYSTYAPANCKATIAWCGNPSLYNDGDTKSAEALLLFNMSQFGDGITDENELEKQLTTNPSAGQYRLQKLNKVINLSKDGPPQYRKEDIPIYKDPFDNHWAKREFQYWEYLKNLYSTNFGKAKNTILLDEPERSLNYSKQKELFLDIIPNQLKDYQVIIASHSLYSIYCKGANIIEMEPNYINNFKEAIQDIANIAKIEENKKTSPQLELPS